MSIKIHKMSEVSTIDFGRSKMCRLCLSSDVAILDLFSFSNRVENILANAIMKCAPVKIKNGDKKPNFICEKCHTRLEKTHQFQMQIIQSDKTLQCYLDKNSNLESIQRPSDNPLIDNTKYKSTESNWRKKDFKNLNPASKINDETSLKSKIRDEQIDDNSSNPAKIDHTVDTSSRGDEETHNRINIADSKLTEEMDVNWKVRESENSACKNTEEMTIKSEIKHEPMDDIEFLTESIDDTIEDSFKGHSLIDNSYADNATRKFSELHDINVNWREKEYENYNSASEINIGMSLKSEMKVEQDNSIISPDCSDNILEPLSMDGKKSLFDVGDNKLGQGMNVNWKLEEPANFDSTCQNIEEITIKSEIKDEPTESIDDSLSDFSKKAREISREDTKVGFDNKDTYKKRYAESSFMKTDKRGSTSEKPYQCDICNKCFTNSGNLNTHTLTHTGEKPHQCDICKKCFTQSNNLNTHKLIHTGEKPYQCDICNKCFNTKGNLNIHKRIHTGERPYQCDVCKKCFSRSNKLNSHKLIHTGEKPYQCDVCNKCFTQSGHLKYHKLAHTGEAQYQCDICKKCFIKLSSLNTHKLSHTGENPYQCDICKKCFTQSGHLNTHKLTHTGEKPYQCDICKKCFTLSCTLNTHKLTHTGEKPHQCDICKKCFTQSSTLNTHKLTHSGKKPYQCDICKKCFTQSGHLKFHKQIHTGDKLYQCDVCNKSFIWKHILIRHKLTHTGEKQYQCDICDKCFARSSTLNTHKLIHTGEKPYQCDICKKCFTHLSNLKVHKVTHTGEKPYQCDICKKCFTQSGHLKFHKQIHTGEKPYQCDVKSVSLT